MKQRVFWFAMLIAAIAVAAIVCMSWGKAEPSFKGRSLQAWMSDLDVLNGSSRKRAARSAIASIGSDAMPTCLQMLSSEDSVMKSTLNRACAGLGIKPVFTAAKTKQLRALGALESLGPSANVAIPQLSPFLTSPDTELRGAAFLTFRCIGQDAKPAIPALFALLTNRTQEIRLSAAFAISDLDGEFSKAAGIGEILHRYDIGELDEYDTCESLLDAGSISPDNFSVIQNGIQRTESLKSSIGVDR